jgi:hypothetical protein
MQILWYKKMLGIFVFSQFAFPVLAAGPKIISVSINTELDEDDPQFCLGAKPTIPGRLYFTRKNESGKWDIYWAKYDSQKKGLAKPEQVGPQIQSEGDDQSPHAMAEGVYPQLFFFASSMDKTGAPRDIYAALRDGPLTSGEERGFGPPRGVTGTISKEDESDPWYQDVGTKQCSLYFTRSTTIGPRIYYCLATKTPGSVPNFQEAKMVEGVPTGFCSPSLTPDGKKLFLQGPVEGSQKQGVFLSYLQSGNWTTPQLISALSFNDSKIGTISPRLNRDGKTLYFASDKPGGKGGLDIYYVSINELQLPK